MARNHHRRKRPIRALAAVGALTGASLLGTPLLAIPAGAASSNGETHKTANEILADARAASEKASTVRIVGQVAESGSVTKFNLVAGHAQGGGTLTESGSTFDVVLHSPKVYLKADKATWTKLENAAVAGLLANRWLQTTTANKEFVDLVQLVDIRGLISQLSPSGKLVKGATTTFDGQSAIPLEDRGQAQGTLYVAATGAPYILGLVGSGADKGTLRFDKYGSAAVPKAPSGSLNLDQLEGSGHGKSPKPKPKS